MLSLFRLERKQKNYSHPFRIRIFLFVSYSFGTETVNTFIHSVVPATQIIPDSRPKWAKCIPVFRPKRRKNPTRWGGTYLYGLHLGSTPPGHDFEEMIRDQVLTLNGRFIGLISPLCDLKSELILQRREILKPLQKT